MPVLYVVRSRDEVEFNIECARWNSVAGVTFSMIFTAARRTVLECMLAPLTPINVENRRELKPNTAIHVVLLQATGKQRSVRTQ